METARKKRTAAQENDCKHLYVTTWRSITLQPKRAMVKHNEEVQADKEVGKEGETYGEGEEEPSVHVDILTDVLVYARMGPRKTGNIVCALVSVQLGVFVRPWPGQSAYGVE